MSDVSGLCSAPIVAATRARGLDPQQLVEGLGLRLEAFENRWGRVPWSEFAGFARRASKMLGEDTLEELAAAATLDGVPGPIRRFLPRLRDSRTLFTLAPRWWGPFVFRGTAGTCERLPDGRLREVVRILPEHPACPEFFAGLRGTLRAMPRLLGQPDALVSLEQDGREGEFLITPPPRRTGWHGLRLRSAPRGPARRLGRELEDAAFAEERLIDSERRIAALRERLRRQTASFDGLNELGTLLVAGPPRDLPSLQETLCRLLERRLGAQGVRLTRRGPESDPSRAVECGDCVGPPVREATLRIGDRVIGRLQVWTAGDADLAASLDWMLPWVAFALEYGGSKALAAHLLDLLSEDARDWQALSARLDRLITGAGSGEGGAEQGIASLDLLGFLARVVDELGPAAVAVGLDDAPKPLFACFDVESLRALLLRATAMLEELAEGPVRLEVRALTTGDRDDSPPTSVEIRLVAEAYPVEAERLTPLRRLLEDADEGLLVTDLEAPHDHARRVLVRLCLPLLDPGVDDAIRV
ncbi:MAG: hypothetical protein R3F16_09650 [Myxococcota bacterium]